VLRHGGGAAADATRSALERVVAARPVPL